MIGKRYFVGQVIPRALANLIIKGLPNPITPTKVSID